MSPVKPIEILLVEDNNGDARLTVESFKDSRIANTLHHVTDGRKALRYLDDLYEEGRNLPDLVLLDLDMPHMDGRELLGRLKKSVRYRKIPTIVLTISQADLDVVNAYDLHANSYIIKPVEFDNFLRVIQAFEGFWLSVVTLPKENS